MTEQVPWQVDTTPDCEREFGKLDPAIQRRIAAHLLDVTQPSSPRQRGKALTGNRRGYWRYRVGDYRIIVTINDRALVVLALAVAKQSEAY